MSESTAFCLRKAVDIDERGYRRVQPTPGVQSVETGICTAILGLPVAVVGGVLGGDGDARDKFRGLL